MLLQAGVIADLSLSLAETSAADSLAVPVPCEDEISQSLAEQFLAAGISLKVGPSS
jgi:hypothetical protein